LYRIDFANEANEAMENVGRLARWRMRSLGRKHYLKHDRKEGWTGELPFYLFFCDACDRFSMDYPHGFIERRYLNCSHCGARHSFVPWWVEWAIAWQTLKFAAFHRFRK
jgi:hypothetical protein